MTWFPTLEYTLIAWRFVEGVEGCWFEPVEQPGESGCVLDDSQFNVNIIKPDVVKRSDAQCDFPGCIKKTNYICTWHLSDLPRSLPTDPSAGKEPGRGVGVHPASHREETRLQLGCGALRLLRSLCWRYDCQYVCGPAHVCVRDETRKTLCVRSLNPSIERQFSNHSSATVTMRGTPVKLWWCTSAVPHP